MISNRRFFFSDGDSGSTEPAPAEAPAEATSGEAVEGEAPFAFTYTGSDKKERQFNSAKQLQNHIAHLANQGAKMTELQKREAALAEKQRQWDEQSQRDRERFEKLQADLEEKNNKLRRLPQGVWDRGGPLDQLINEGAGPQGVEQRLEQLLEEKLQPLQSWQQKLEEQEQAEKAKAESDQLFQELATKLGGEYADFDADYVRGQVDSLYEASNEPGGLMEALMRMAYSARTAGPSAEVKEANGVKAAAEKARAKLAAPRGMSGGRTSGPAKDGRGRVSIEAARKRAYSRAKDLEE